jgi:hypothetical protein
MEAAQEAYRSFLVVATELLDHLRILGGPSNGPGQLTRDFFDTGRTLAGRAWDVWADLALHSSAQASQAAADFCQACVDLHTAAALTLEARETGEDDMLATRDWQPALSRVGDLGHARIVAQNVRETLTE